MEKLFSTNLSWRMERQQDEAIDGERLTWMVEETKGHDIYGIGRFWWFIAILNELRVIWKITILIIELFKSNWE